MKKVVKTLLVDASGSILFLTRSTTHPRFAHEADLPGGIIESSESIQKALVREVLEECGINIRDKKIYKISEIKYNSNWYYILAIVICDSLLPKLSWEHEGYFVCNIKNVQNNTKLINPRDPYMRFAYKSIIANTDRLIKLMTDHSIKTEN